MKINHATCLLVVNRNDKNAIWTYIMDFKNRKCKTKFFYYHLEITLKVTHLVQNIFKRHKQVNILHKTLLFTAEAITLSDCLNSTNHSHRLILQCPESKIYAQNWLIRSNTQSQYYVNWSFIYLYWSVTYLLTI